MTTDFDTANFNALDNNALNSNTLNSDTANNAATSDNANRNAPIGLFDSGVGGLSIYLHLQKQLPNERFIYYADSQNLPYGDKTHEQISTFTEQAVAWLMTQGVKMIVIACNSASAYTLERLRGLYHIPIVGLVPALKPATKLTKTGNIAVLATQATLNGNSLNAIIQNHASPYGIVVKKYFEPSLVPWVELGMPNNHPACQYLADFLKTLQKERVDVLVLGCTHYPFFRPHLQHHINKHHLTISLIDSGLAIAQRVQFLLDEWQLSTKDNSSSIPLQFYSSKAGSELTAKRLINLPLVVIKDKPLTGNINLANND